MARQPPDFRKVLKPQPDQAPRVITADKNAAYSVAIEGLQEDETITEETQLRQSKYVNNTVEQDHRTISG